MNGWILSLLILLAGLAFVRLWTALWTRVWRLRRAADEVHTATTTDSWRLALHRYRPAAARWAEPLLLCHGLGANRYNFDLADDRSLARWLAGRGFDVWVLELRGAGQSSRPEWFSPFHWGFDFDDHLERDAPAALGLVRAVTQRERVFWIGHSMGGMLGYALLAAGGAETPLAGLVTVGSPARLDLSRSVRRLRLPVRLLALGRVVPLQPLARFGAPLAGWLPGTGQPFYLPGGIERAMLRRVAVNLVTDVSGALLRQLLRWIDRARVDSRDGARDLLAGLENTERPVLLLAGEADRLAVPAGVEAVYQRLGTHDKQMRVLGIDRGDEADFGHGDLLLGHQAREQVYPEIGEWLETRATPLGVAQSAVPPRLGAVDDDEPDA